MVVPASACREGGKARERAPQSARLAHLPNSMQVFTKKVKAPLDSFWRAMGSLADPTYFLSMETFVLNKFQQDLIRNQASTENLKDFLDILLRYGE